MLDLVMRKRHARAGERLDSKPQRTDEKVLVLAQFEKRVPLHQASVGFKRAGTAEKDVWDEIHVRAVGVVAAVLSRAQRQRFHRSRGRVGVSDGYQTAEIELIVGLVARNLASCECG